MNQSKVRARERGHSPVIDLLDYASNREGRIHARCKKNRQSQKRVPDPRACACLPSSAALHPLLEQSLVDPDQQVPMPFQAAEDYARKVMQ